MIEKVRIWSTWYCKFFHIISYTEISCLCDQQCFLIYTEGVLGWTESGSVPNCLRHRVKKFELKGIQGEEEGIGLIQYLLMHGTVSETCTIWSKGPVSKRKLKILRHKLLQLHRGSETFEIQLLCDKYDAGLWLTFCCCFQLHWLHCCFSYGTFCIKHTTFARMFLLLATLCLHFTLCVRKCT